MREYIKHWCITTIVPTHPPTHSLTHSQLWGWALTAGRVPAESRFDGGRPLGDGQRTVVAPAREQVPPLVRVVVFVGLELELQQRRLALQILGREWVGGRACGRVLAQSSSWHHTHPVVTWSTNGATISDTRTIDGP